MSKIDEEFQKLLQFFRSPDAQKMKVEDAVKIIMDFFEKLKFHLEHASPDEKAAFITKMSHMYQQLLEATKQITQK
ncbi:MAG TPA: hypothetical protein VLG49_04040, partial [Rhabdochlamydiaceae bacterium]|nr:hypothetical protein [Rhabdochlamydiaceae bacterium]